MLFNCSAEEVKSFSILCDFSANTHTHALTLTQLATTEAAHLTIASNGFKSRCTEQWRSVGSVRANVAKRCAVSVQVVTHFDVRNAVACHFLFKL